MQLKHIVLFFYSIAGLMLFFELLQSFINVKPDNTALLVPILIAASLSRGLEAWAFFVICLYLAFIIISFCIRSASSRLRPDLRDTLGKYRERFQLQSETQEPSTLVLAAFYLFWPLMVIHGAIFNRAVGTPIIKGAVQHFIAFVRLHLFVYGIVLAGYIALFGLGAVIAVTVRAYSTRRRSTEADEEGLLGSAGAGAYGATATTH